jgi:WD40 repeat protein
MFMTISAMLSFCLWFSQANPPGQIATIGSTAFRHPDSRPLGHFVVLGTSAGGERVYTGDFSGCSSGRTFNAVYVWEAKTGKLLNKYAPASELGRVWKYRFTPDSLEVLVLPDRGLLKPGECRFALFDLDTGRLIRKGDPWRPPGARRRGWSDELSFATELQSEAWTVHHTQREVILLDPKTGRTLDFTPSLKAETAEAAISPDGKTGVAEPVDGKIRLYELPAMKVKAEWDATRDRRVDGFTPDSRHLIVWDKKDKGWSLELWSIAGLDRHTLLEEERDPGDVHFSPNGRLFAQRRLGLDDQFEDWEIRNTMTGKLLFKLENISSYGVPVFDRDGKTVWAMGSAQLLVPYDVATGKPRPNGPETVGAIERFRFLSEERVIGLSNSAVITWEARTSKEISRTAIPRQRDRRFKALFSSSGDRLVYTSPEGAVIAWNPITRTERKITIERGGREPSILDEPLTSDGQLHIARNGEKLTFRNPVDGKVMMERPTPEWWNGANNEWGYVLSPDGKHLAAAQLYFGPKTLYLLDPTNPKAEATALSLDHTVSALTFSNDNRFLLALGEGEARVDGTGLFTVWDLTALDKKPRTKSLKSWGVISAKFAPDSKLLAVHCRDRVLVVDTTTWSQQARIIVATPDYCNSLPPEEQGDTLAWSPSGRLLAMQLGDERIAVWDVEKLQGK